MKRLKTHHGCKSVCSDGSGWDSLLTEVAFPVLEKLLEPLDHVRFASVCKRWSSIAKDYNHTTQRWRNSKQALPMLLIPPSSSPAKSQGVVLYSVTKRTVYNNIVLPVPADEKYCGFSHGWLASIDESLTNITLRKFPAARNGRLNVIHLPPLEHGFTYYKTESLPKVILSADPTLHPNSYAVSALFNHSHKVAYLAGERGHWRYNSTRELGSFPKYAHAIFYRNHVYLVNLLGNYSLCRFDVDSALSYLDFKRVNTQPQISPKRCTYFVETTEGKLLLVEKVSAHKEVSATTFKVSQVVTDESSYGSVDAQVLELNSIGDEALFVCECHSMSVLASNFGGCKPNSIYYAYNSGSTWEIGIFSLENKSTTRLHTLNHCESDYMPFWITPSFQGLC